MRRARLVVLLLVLGGLGFAAYAYITCDPASPTLDLSEEIPEGRGFAPRPARSWTSLLPRLGRWLHARLDPVLGLPGPEARKEGEVRLLATYVALGPPGALHVRVHHPDGSAVGAVYVTVYRPYAPTSPTARLVEAQGEVRFDDLPSGPGYVVEAALGNGEGDPTPIVRQGTQVTAGVVNEVQVTMPGGTIEGQVVDGYLKEPVPRARVEAHAHANSERATDYVIERIWFAPAGETVRLGETVADAEGRFRLGPLPAGPSLEVRVRTEAGRAGSGLAARAAGPASNLRIEAWARRTVSASVVDEEGRAVEGALVRIANAGGEARTNAAGRFTLEVRESTPVVIERGGAALGNSVAGMLLDGAYLQFPTRTTLDLRVVAASGSGVPQATVYAHGTAEEGDHGYWVRAAADATGHAVIPVLPGRIDRIDVRSPTESAQFDDLPSSLTLPAQFRDPIRAGETRRVQLTMPVGHVVRGRAVMPDGRPAARARVWSMGERGYSGQSEAVTAEDGRFTLIGVDPGASDSPPAEVTLSGQIAGVAAGRATLESSQAVAEQPRTYDAGDLVLRPGALLRGRVVDEGGAPVVHARVTGQYRLDGGTRTDERGVYRLPVDPELSPRLRVAAPGTRAREVLVVGLLRSGEVRDVEPIVLRRPVTLRVRVVDLEDAPIAGAEVYVTPSPRPTASPPRTDARGWIEVAEFGSSPVDAEAALAEVVRLLRGFDGERVHVRLPDGTVVERSVVVPEDASGVLETTVRVPSRFEVVGLVRGEEGEAIPGVEVTASVGRRPESVHVPPDLARTPREDRSATVDSAGRFRMVLMGVRGERWTLAAEAADGRSGKTEVVAEGRTAAEIRLRPHASDDTETTGVK
ncbi:MAG TPA: carboxypeptidase-like regulatory domain-containing protein [Planctomycetota bacterium]|nr:carboxypeptidase-like regulatory domain-containing protein [Planctomycetota bacterium]